MFVFFSWIKPGTFHYRHKHKRKHNNLRQVKTNIDYACVQLMFTLMSGPFSLEIGTVVLPFILMLYTYVASENQA